MLFEDAKYIGCKFPESQYSEARYIHRGWTAQFVPGNACLFKQLGKRVIINVELFETLENYQNGMQLLDFFLNDYPTDLNVAFSQNQYMEEKLEKKLGKRELTWLYSNRGEMWHINGNKGE